MTVTFNSLSLRKLTFLSLSFSLSLLNSFFFQKKKKIINREHWDFNIFEHWERILFGWSSG